MITASAMKGLTVVVVHRYSGRTHTETLRRAFASRGLLFKQKKTPRLIYS